MYIFHLLMSLSSKRRFNQQVFDIFAWKLLKRAVKYQNISWLIFYFFSIPFSIVYLV